MNEFNSESNQIDDNPTTQQNFLSKRPSVFLVVLLIILGLTIFLAFVLNLNSRTNENEQTPIAQETDTDTSVVSEEGESSYDSDEFWSEEEKANVIEDMPDPFSDADYEAVLTDAELQAVIEELGSQSQ
jgi:hypothetical protein